MVKVLIIISQRNFNDTEFSVTKKTLEQREVEVAVSSITKEEALGMDGLRITPGKTVRETNPNEYDALVIIGGSGSPNLLNYPEILERVRQFHEKEKIVSAICLAPIILAKAGILKNIMSTVFPIDWAITSLKNNGANYSSDHVVEDGNIITADGPQSAGEFGKRILKRFNL